MNDSDHPYEHLQMRYAGSLASKRGDLAQAWHAFAADPGADPARRELHVQIHRLSGSAASYGYVNLGAHARAVDEIMSQPDMRGASPPAALADQVARLAVPIQALLAALDEATAHAADEPPAIP